MDKAYGQYSPILNKKIHYLILAFSYDALKK